MSNDTNGSVDLQASDLLLVISGMGELANEHGRLSSRATNQADRSMHESMEREYRAIQFKISRLPVFKRGVTVLGKRNRTTNGVFSG